MQVEIEKLERRIKVLESQLRAAQHEGMTSGPAYELQRVINDTGRIAKVGGWHVDLLTGQATWTNETFQIFEIEPSVDNIPVIADAFVHYPGKSKDIIQNAVQRVIEYGESYDIVVEFLTAKGNPRWVRTFGVPTWSSGKVVAISGAIQDVTTLKNYEMEIERHRDQLEIIVAQRTQQLREEKENVSKANAEIRQKQELLSTVLNNVDALVYMTDSQGKYLYLNPKAAEFLRSSVERVLGKSIHDVATPELAVQISKMDQKVLATGDIHSGEENFVDDEGHSRHYWSTKIPILDGDGVARSLIGILTNITKLSTTDTLTGVNNRRVLNVELEKSFTALVRQHRPYCVIIGDIDFFKKINDTRGHLAGDAALMVVAKSLQASLRLTDVLGRWGGEEFLVVCNESTLESAANLAERLRLEVEHASQELKFPISMSLGVAQGRGDDADFNSVIERADQCLYRAKEGGRNRVCF